ncbi:MAG: glycosyltransferase family 4 protein [Ignavibacteriales bacterium]|nr:glycosyltransferase family 4 protein [Ignavibacteriales bacterium]MBI3788268.1 glycosyltransferase family 4 protein [Ignavibacteriales bacterium]
MHTLYLNYHYDKDLTTATSLLERYHSSKNWCEAIVRQGGKISYVQRFHFADHQIFNGVEYHFVADNLPPHLSWFQNPKLFHKEIVKLQPDVIHYNGQVFHLKYLRPLLREKTAIVWQHHGGPPPSLPKKFLYKQALRLLDGFMFTSAQQAEEWKNAGLIFPRQAIYEVLESSTLFTPLPCAQVRRPLCILGEEVFLWVGRLNANKDPLTVLKGFAFSVKHFRNPHLYIIYSGEDLLDDLQNEIRSLSLCERVHLLGKISHAELPQYYSGANYFVLGSHHEGSGFALLEAMACGAIPIVTDIPSFRKITGNGIAGHLWKTGDPNSFAETLQRVQSKKMDRDSIMDYFQSNLSFDCVGREALTAYNQLWEHRQSNS